MIQFLAALGAEYLVAVDGVAAVIAVIYADLSFGLGVRVLFHGCMLHVMGCSAKLGILASICKFLADNLQDDA